MNKSVCGNQINKELPVLQSSNRNDYDHYKIPQSIMTKTNSNKNNVSSNYKDILLTLRGEVSSANIYRNNIIQKPAEISFMDDMEENDEQFFLDIKRNIDKNNKMQSKENYNVRDLQSKSYISRKKKSVFNEEDQSLMKRFKNSVDEKKTLCIASQKFEQSEDVTSVINHNHSIETASCDTAKITPTLAFHNTDIDLRDNTNENFFRMFSKMQKNNHFITPSNTVTANETEIEQLIYCETQYFTPPQKKD